MNAIASILFGFISAPVMAFMTAGTSHKLWEWYVSGQYGSGPTYGVWYGFFLIFALMLCPHMASIAREKTSEDNLFAQAVGRFIVVATLCGTILLGGWFVGAVTGWAAW